MAFNVAAIPVVPAADSSLRRDLLHDGPKGNQAPTFRGGSKCTDNTSWRGATLEARKILSQNLTVGLLFGWYVFDEITVGTASFPGIDVTGVPYTYLNSFPIQATAHYYLGKRRGTRLHFGGGAGVTINERRLDVGLYRIQRTKAQFSVFPEIGVSIPLDWSLRGVLAVRYNYSLKSGDTPAQEYVGISVGLAWN